MSKTVEFTARMNGGSVEWEADDGKPAKDHRLHVPPGASAERIDYKIRDQTGLQLRFDPATPIDVWEQAGCPPPGVATDQIEIVDSNPNKLTIRNLNTGPARRLQYQLNLVASDGTRHSCDPIIDNGGGGPGEA